MFGDVHNDEARLNIREEGLKRWNTCCHDRRVHHDLGEDPGEQCFPCRIRLVGFVDLLQVDEHCDGKGWHTAERHLVSMKHRIRGRLSTYASLDAKSPVTTKRFAEDT